MPKETIGMPRGRPRKSTEDIRRGVDALDHALALLKVLAHMDGAASLSDIARASSMPITKAHRYLASFIAAGLVSQPERSGRYDLGQEALNLGLAALARNDIVNRVSGQLADLTEATGCTAMLSVWSNLGPTVIRWERSANFIVTTLGLGTTFPLLGSATGKVFLAHLPARLTQALLDKELVLRSTASDEKDFDYSIKGITHLRENIRKQGYATVEGRLIPGLHAASAPVLNWQREIECAVTLISTNPEAFDQNGIALPALIQFAFKFSNERLAPKIET